MVKEAINLTPIINAVIALIAAIIATFIIPAIKKYTSEKEREELMVWVNVAVKAAEQLAKSGVIDKEERLDKVYEFLQNKNLIVNFDEVKMLIEAYVKDLPSLTVKSDISKDTVAKVEEKITSDKIDEAVKEMIKEEENGKG